MRFQDPTVPRGHNRPRGSGMSRAQEAAIESELARYVALECGHLTTREVIILYACFGRVETYCETCEDWKDIAKKTRPVAYPAVPLF